MTTHATEAIAGTPRQVAQQLQCSPSTIYRAIHSGQLEAVRLGEHGSLRIREDAIARFVRPVQVEGATRPPLRSSAPQHVGLVATPGGQADNPSHDAREDN